MQVSVVIDYRSIYSYLANSQLRTLDATINYQVVDIVAVMKEVNNQPSPKCPPKVKYAKVDAMRWARRYGLPLAPNEALLGAMQQGHLENALLSRVGLAAQQLGIFEEVNNALFSAVWASSEDLVTTEGRSEFAVKRSLPVELWDIAESADVMAQLAANNERAVADGVFGVPTFLVDHEMFFGNDRLAFVKEKLDAARTGVAR